METINSKCGLQKPTDIPAPIVPPKQSPTPFCATAKFYTTKQGDTCDMVAQRNNASSSALYMANQHIILQCKSLNPGVRLCLPTQCERLYLVNQKDTCDKIEMRFDLRAGTVKKFNAWLNYDCSNLQAGVKNMGRVLCLSPPGGTFTAVAPPKGLPNQNNGLRGA